MVIKCPECKHYITDTTAVCPHCGYLLNVDVQTPPTVERCTDPVLPEAGSPPVMSETPANE